MTCSYTTSNGSVSMATNDARARCIISSSASGCSRSFVSTSSWALTLFILQKASIMW